MRYGHFGVGHPVAMRRMTKDCMEIVDGSDDVDYAAEDLSDGEGFDGCSEDDDDETSDEELSDEELEHEDEGVEQDHGQVDDWADDDDLLSF